MKSLKGFAAMTSSGADRLFRVDGLVALITGGGTGGSSTLNVEIANN